MHVEKYGFSKWNVIAKQLNQLFYDGNDIRRPRQCRENYLSNLCINKDNRKKGWTKSDDLSVMKLQVAFGNKWAKISRQLTGRTENDVRNRFNSLIGKKSGKPKAIDAVIQELEREVAETDLTVSDEIQLGFEVP
jgi:hypothetical protein